MILQVHNDPTVDAANNMDNANLIGIQTRIAEAPEKSYSFLPHSLIVLQWDV